MTQLRGFSKEKGGTPGSARHEVLNMDAVAEIQKIRNAVGTKNVVPVRERKVSDFIKGGFVRLTAFQMSKVLEECEYEHQRPINAEHVRVLADMMERGRFGRSSIDFAEIYVDDVATLIYVNGYHRGAAHVMFGGEIDYAVNIHPCETMDDVAEVYRQLDRNILSRTNNHILNAADLSGRLGLMKETARYLYEAVPTIVSGFSSTRKDYNNLVAKVYDRREPYCVDYSDAAYLYEQCLEGQRAAFKKRMFTAGVMSVALVTLRYQKEKAVEFWRGVAENDGLRRGDPRQTLFNDIISRNRASGSISQRFAPSALAWNAWFEGRDLKLIKVNEGYTCTILGTPFAKKRR